MTALGKITAAVRQAAIDSLNQELVRDVRVEPAIGSDGDEILRITILLNENALDKIDDDKFLSTLVSVNKGVRDTGDDRQAVLGYATPADLEENGDSES